MNQAFGIIPLREKNRAWETLLVKHQKGHWAFPKGHPEPGEMPQETALRELKEETGLKVKHLLPKEPLKEFYIFKQEGKLVEKTVTYYLAEVEGEVTLQREELEACRWLSFGEAAKLATFPESKKLAEKARYLVVKL